jgi:hypothetical protein
MRRRPPFSLLLLAATLVGCFHATIDTGAKPSTVTVEKRWASGWIFGLVPPKTVETASKCTTGVSRIETQLSFVNMLVSFLTLDIYTPMDIRVTCAEGASGGTSLIVPDSASVATWQAAIATAATESRSLGQPVFLQTSH